MAKCLRLNRETLVAEYVAHMGRCIDRLLDEYYREVAGALRSEAARGDVQVERLDSADKAHLVRRLVAGPLAVMDSWGTGSMMDTGNPALPGYIGGPLYNPARGTQPGAPITGRPEGPYVNIFGETVVSSGAMEGLNLEAFPGLPIRPREPSYAFQNAEKWFAASRRVQEEIEKETEGFWGAVRENPARFMTFG
ncbi:MAG: hypothetical protein GXY32_06560 [Ruminococcaceae bacterium]|nr:hypothetical protein [Oscillospiraceae bacterium]